MHIFQFPYVHSAIYENLAIFVSHLPEEHTIIWKPTVLVLPCLAVNVSLSWFVPDPNKCVCSRHLLVTLRLPYVYI